MTELEELAYIRGRESAFAAIAEQLFNYASGEIDGKVRDLGMWVEVSHQIRDLWDMVEDEPYPDDLDLRDVLNRIGKHVAELVAKEEGK